MTNVRFPPTAHTGGGTNGDDRYCPIADGMPFGIGRRVSYEGVNYEPAIKVGHVAAIGFAIALIAIFQPFAQPEPANSYAYGCYVSTVAPYIYLDQSGMTILQPGFARFPYHIERH